MKQINHTFGAIVLTAVFILVLSSCHRNTCPTWNKVDTESEIRS